MTHCKIRPVALGLAFGVTWGVSVFLMGIIAYLYAYGKPFVEAMSALYIGYEPSIAGSVIGGVIGFIDAFIGGAVIAWLYNKFAGCCHKEDSKCCK